VSEIGPAADEELLASLRRRSTHHVVEAKETTTVALGTSDGSRSNPEVILSCSGAGQERSGS